MAVQYWRKLLVFIFRVEVTRPKGRQVIRSFGDPISSAKVMQQQKEGVVKS